MCNVHPPGRGPLILLHFFYTRSYPVHVHPSNFFIHIWSGSSSCWGWCLKGLSRVQAAPLASSLWPEKHLLPSKWVGIEVTDATVTPMLVLSYLNQLRSTEVPGKPLGFQGWKINWPKLLITWSEQRTNVFKNLYSVYRMPSVSVLPFEIACLACQYLLLPWLDSFPSQCPSSPTPQQNPTDLAVEEAGGPQGLKASSPCWAGMSDLSGPNQWDTGTKCAVFFRSYVFALTPVPISFP